MPIILAIANMLGISVFRLIAYAAIAATVTAGAVAIRHHYVDLGFKKAIEAVKKQDDKAIGAAQAVERKATLCTNDNGYWDVITQACKLDSQP